MMEKKSKQQSFCTLLFTDCGVSRKSERLFSRICAPFGLSAFAGRSFCQK